MVMARGAVTAVLAWDGALRTDEGGRLGGARWRNGQ